MLTSSLNSLYWVLVRCWELTGGGGERTGLRFRCLWPFGRSGWAVVRISRLDWKGKESWGLDIVMDRYWMKVLTSYSQSSASTSTSIFRRNGCSISYCCWVMKWTMNRVWTFYRWKCRVISGGAKMVKVSVIGFTLRLVSMAPRSYS